MKKLLIATTALVAGASAAAADVTISGYGRFGLQYVEDRGLGLEDTIISSRLRLNIDATTETDVGVTFGARLRMQYDDGDAGTIGNAARFSIGYEGLTVQVGNVDTPWDSVGLTYNSEMGYEDSSFGDDNDSPFFAYNSKTQPNGYQGVAATYSISDINLYFSYIDPNQIVDTLPAGVSEEVGLAADWSNGQISVAAAINNNVGGNKDYDAYFLGGAYNFGDGNVGLNFYNYDNPALNDSYNQITLYGNYTFGATTLRAYISDLDADGADTAYGIGADYSLGEGARISGSIQRGFGSDVTFVDNTGARFNDARAKTVADIGVRFDF
ncbi:porin [Paracoccus sp. IB05]|uniref:porin n=1 Tax=Paracoccus sp. IB05 TaxID=2779367 RepID=UPI0018E8F51B|nr:porin [Paracoccus sp. IB05]MBJ2152403.1 porin [Paracoccus sp. IB05]